MMEIPINDNLLSAYAEGQVSDPERDAVRRYLTDHPDELQTVAIMMDDDYELTPDDHGDDIPADLSAAHGDADQASQPSGFGSYVAGMGLAALGAFISPCISFSAAAFVPRRPRVASKPADAKAGVESDASGFAQRLDSLIDEIDD